MNSPILFLVFNRPELTSRVFEVIRTARPSKLYVAADGPRLNRDDDIELCKRVRDTVQVDWPCEVFTLYQNENLGCKKAVIKAINWFFTHEIEGIIIEDDVLPNSDFFRFCDAMLERYRHDSRIGIISGCNLLGANIESNNYFYSQIYPIWGWATWKRVWEQYDEELEAWPSAQRKSSLRERFSSALYLYYSSIFTIHQTLNVNTWDTQLVYSLLFNNCLAITPAANMISNIGIVGTHTSFETKSHNVQYGISPGETFTGPETLFPDSLFHKEMARVFFIPAIVTGYASVVLRYCGLYSAAKKALRFVRGAK